MASRNKLKTYIRFNTNLHDHSKLFYNKLNKKKWLRVQKGTPKRSSEYGSLLVAKQALRYFYGNLSERQFISLYKKAKTLKGNTGFNFVKLLERRLDTVLFRMRFGETFDKVRQMISHKHILVNGNIINSSAFMVSIGDIISVQKDSYSHVSKLTRQTFETSFNTTNVENASKDKLLNLVKERKLMFTPDYIEVNYNTLKGQFLYSPSFEEVIYPFPTNLLKITQYYEYKLKI